MGIFSNIVNKMKGIDPFYEDVKKEQIGLYQHFFNKVITSINILNQTNWSKGGSNYNKSQFDKDEIIMEQIILDGASRAGLNPVLLQIMVNQYFFADDYQRECDCQDWVKRVIHRKDPDYFPDGWQVRTLLEKVT